MHIANTRSTTKKIRQRGRTNKLREKIKWNVNTQTIPQKSGKEEKNEQRTHGASKKKIAILYLNANKLHEM